MDQGTVLYVQPLLIIVLSAPLLQHALFVHLDSKVLIVWHVRQVFLIMVEFVHHAQLQSTPDVDLAQQHLFSMFHRIYRKYLWNL